MADVAPSVRPGNKLLATIGLTTVVGLLVLVIGAMRDIERVLNAYLCAFGYIVSIGLGALAVLMIAHVMNARWVTPVRRFVESLSGLVYALPILAVPVIVGYKLIYPWAHPERLSPELRELVHKKSAWLNGPFFVVRAVIYLGVWFLIALLLRRWSRAQDSDGSLKWLVKMRRLSAGGLPAYAITLTFAAFDWYMSLTPEWFSSIFGVYFFAGGFQAALALLVLVASVGEAGPLRGIIGAEHYRAIGKLLFAFTIFWAYIAFSQYFIIWIANLPEEVSFFVPRSRGAWGWIGVVLVVGRFAVPFFLLLSRARKASPRYMAPICVWILAFHFVDHFWMVAPVLAPDVPPWPVLELAGVAFTGGVATLLVLTLDTGSSALAHRDPYFTESLRYRGL